MAAKPKWMIYGANGYTGELIAREAARRGLAPVLAGRSREKIEQLASELKLEARVFGLDSAKAVARELDGSTLVLHCAGPFSATAASMMEACMQARAHYLDITGEVAVFELAQQLGARASTAGVVLCPGVGFDVIPSDCLAATLKQALPDATHLALGFDTRTGPSAGTAKTAIEALAEGGRVRRDGKIVAVPLAWKSRRIDFGDGEKNAVTIPWGDVSTAYHSTGIPNIEVYIPASPRAAAGMKRMNALRWLLALPPTQWAMKRGTRAIRGPSAEKRAKLPTFLWGEVRNAAGTVRVGRIRVPNTYDITITGSLTVVDHLLGAKPAPGAYTPSRLLGADLVTRLPDCGPIQITG